MSIVTRAAKKSPRLFAIALLIALVSTFVLASRLEGVTTFVRQSTGADSLVEQPAIFNSQQETPVLQTGKTDDALLAPLTGTLTIPGDYPDLASAIADLNAQGVGAGGVTFNLLAGNTQTAPAGGYVIGGTGSLVLTSSSAANPIVFNGGGNIINAPTPQATGSLTDAIFKLIGADFVTLNDFKMKENVANTTTTAASNNMTEFGVALFYVTTTDGAQNNNIFSSTIDLNRTYQNTFGIYSNSTHSATTLTAVTATGAAGSNTGLKIQANAISNANMGIVVVGPTAAADQADTLDIGGNALAFGNTMTDIGTTGTFSGYANVSGTVNGILVRNTKNFNVSNNNIQMSNGGVTVTGTINGIQIPASSNAPTGTLTQTINNNQISVRGGNAANTLNGINMPTGSVTATTTVNMNNNNFNTFGHTVAGGTGAISFIIHGGNPLAQTMNGNTFTNISVNTTGTITFFSFAPSLISGASFSLSNNSIVTGFTRTGVGSTTIWSSNGSSVTGSTQNMSNNNFSNITLTGTSAFNGIVNTDGASATSGPVKTINGNTFNNINTGAATIIPMNVNFSAPGTTVNTNTISNITTGNSITGLTLGSSNQATITASGNTISGLNSAGTAVTGLFTQAITAVISKNKIYDLNGSVAGSVVVGLDLANTSNSSTVTASNNLIGNLTAPLATSSNGIVGIRIPNGVTTSTFNVFYNTVYLNNTASGAGFGSSGIFTLISTVATTTTLNLRNNIIVNTSVQNGAGLTVAYRRSAGAANNLANYAGTSNNNLFYAGTPSPTNLIYSDGTSSAQTILNYKNGVFTAGTISPRDSASISENPPFLSTTGSSPNFLHINPATPTQIESGATSVAGITDDFDGDTRNVSTPDIGADEFVGIPIDLVGPSITYTPLSNTSSTANRNLSVTITDGSGVAGGALAPRIYFRKNGGSYVSTQCTGASPTYTCTIDNSLVSGVVATDIIDYFVIAQDTAGNVSVNPATGASASNVNTVTTPPTTPNTYTISTPFPATVNVPGDYASLTNTGGVFEAMNAGIFTGNTVINIAADLTGETGTVALNKLAEEGVGAGTFTVTIKPTGVARSITGAAASTALIRLNGANRVTIDGSLIGGNDRSLTITNTSTTAPQVVRFGSIGTTPITGDTLKNCIIINGVNTSSAVVVTDNAGTAGTFNNITIQNNDVQKAFIAIFTNATVLAGNGSGLLITQNKLDTSGANAIRSVGVYVQGADGATVSSNTVGNINATNDENDTGIWLAAGAVNTTVSGNTVTALGYTGTGTFGPFGIRDSGGSTTSGNNITQNNISNITSNGTLTTGPTVFGIENSSGGTIIQRNNVQGVIATSTGTFGAAGINITAGNNVVVRNNFVSNVTGDMTGGAAFSTTFGIFGIRVAAGTGHQVHNNSVNMYGLRTGVATTTLLTASFAIVNTTSTGMDVRNNIFANNITGGTTSIANVSVFLPSGGTSAMNLTWNNNSYYFGTDTARQGAGQAGTTAGTNFFTTLATLAAYTGTLSGAGTNDNASLSSTGAVPFTSANDLHISPGAVESNVGATIAAVTNDYDGEARPQGAGYEIGADELVVAAPAGTVQFSSATYLVTEGTPTVTLTVTRSGGSSGAVMANYALAGGTATGGAACGGAVDYQNTAGTVNFADGDAADKTFNVPICDDSLFEGSETFDATLSIGSGAATLGTPNPATVTITDNDAQPSLQFSAANVSVGEGVGTVTLTVTRTGATDNVVSASYSTPSNTASGGASCTAGVDFINTAGTVSFGAGVTSQTFNVTICDDSLFESSENFVASLSTPTGGAVIGTPGSETVTITENDTAPTFQFSSATYSNNDDIAQNAGQTDELAPQTATITVMRSGATENAVSVNYATVAGGTATAGGSCTTGVDYISTNGTLSFAATETVKTFNITVCSDNLFEGNESVNLALSSPTAPAVLGAPNTAVLTIVDNETVPTLQFSSATYSNSDDIMKYGITTDEFAPSVATIMVTRTGAIDNAVTVNYATSNGTATGGASCTTGVDYINASGTLSFAAGITSQTFNVTVCTDALFEGNETVNLTLSSPSSPAALGTPNSAVLTIVDNDAQPSLQFSTATYSVGEAGPTATITVTRTGAPDNAVSVNYASVAGGTATGGVTCTAGVDYQNTSGTLNFASGVLSQTFNVPVCEDALLEGNETVNLALSTPTGAVLGTQNTAVLTIVDNDVAQPGSLQFSSATYSVGEAGPTSAITVTRTGGTDGAVGVSFATVAGGTATGGASCTAGVDYISTNGTLSWTDGDSTSKTFSINICDDNVYETPTPETVNLAVSNPTGGATLGSQNTAVLNINENDAQPSVQFGFLSGSAGEGLTFSAQVSRQGALGNAIGVSFATSDGTATGGAACTAGVDYINTSGTLSWAANDAAFKAFNVVLCDDSVIESGETINLTLSNPTGGAGLGVPSSIVLTITDNDSQIQFSSATYSQSETGPTATITATRTGTTLGFGATVNYATVAGGTATGGGACGAGIDFVNTSGTLTFTNTGAGNTTQTFTVPICDDALAESSETINLQLSMPGPGANITLGSPSTATLTITDNDTAPTVQFSSATYSTVESLGNSGVVPSATITVTRTGATENAFTVNYATSNGSATGGASCTAGIDYVSTSGTLSFASGDTSKTFNVQTCMDTVYEGNETVNLALTGPTAPAVLGTPNTAVLTIVENDAQPSVQFSAAAYTEDESQTAGIGITRTGDTSGTTTVNFATSNGTATGGASCTLGVDYVTNSGTVTFNPGVVSQIVSVQLCSDTMSESGETITLTLSSPSAPAILGTPATAILTINDTASQYRNVTNIDVTGTIGTPYPANIVVAGGPATVGSVKVTLFDVSHALADDLDVLLVGPGGQKFILMADAGGANGLTSSATITFDDQAAQVLPDNGTILTGKYEPTSWEPGQTSFLAPAPPAPYSEPGSTVGGAVTLNSVFAGTNPNGTWSLYTRNDNGAFVPVGGNIAGGWGLQILAPTAANVEISGRLLTASGEGIRNATVMLSGGNLTQPVQVQTGTFGYYRFSNLVVGQTYVITVISKRYTFPNPSRVINLVDNVTDENFEAESQ
jgi:hypothetical protein